MGRWIARQTGLVGPLHWDFYTAIISFLKSISQHIIVNTEFLIEGYFKPVFFLNKILSRLDSCSHVEFSITPTRLLRMGTGLRTESITPLTAHAWCLGFPAFGIEWKQLPLAKRITTRVVYKIAEDRKLPQQSKNIAGQNKYWNIHKNTGAISDF